MKANMGVAHRVIYAVLGVGMVGAPFLTSADTFYRVLFPVMGGLALVSALTGR